MGEEWKREMDRECASNCLTYNRQTTGLSAVSNWGKLGGSIRSSLNVFVVSDEGVQRRVRWGKVGPKGLPYIPSRS